MTFSPYRFLLTLVVTMVCVFLVGEMPYFFFDIGKMQVDPIKNIAGAIVGVNYIADLAPSWPAYFKQFIPSLHEMLHPTTMTYLSFGTIKPLFPELLEKYFYSMKILGGALLCAFFISVILTIGIMMLPNWFRKAVKALMGALQAVPDIFYLLFFIVLIITFYEKTHLLIFQIAQYNTKIYGLPIFILTFLPTIQIMQYLVVDMEYELSEPYVEFAGAKGLKKGRIIVVHVFRNAIITFLTNLKTIFWFALTNLIMVEIILNMNGIMSFLFYYGLKTPEVLTVSLLMIVVPFVILFYIGQWLSDRLTEQKGSGLI